MSVKDVANIIISNIEEIAQEIIDAEAIQNSDESKYTKEMTKIHVYECIAEMLN